MPLPHRLPIVVLLLAVAALASACGEDDPAPGGAGDEPSQAAAPATDEATLEHIHGLGVDARDGRLYIATHYGLFQSPKGDTRIERIGESQQDIMGFSVVGEDRFIGSGHPGAGQNLPPNLGLIESRDRGRTWQDVSLSGEADFHVLRSAGSRVYGLDGTQGRLMVSRDGGRTWKETSPPPGVFDLAIDPGDEDHIVVSTEQGMFASKDAGEGWRPLSSQLAGLVAWPSRDAMYLVDGEGQAHRSADGGRSFDAAGSIGGQPVALESDKDDLYVALPDGTVKQSSDAGRGWTVRATP